MRVWPGVGFSLTCFLIVAGLRKDTALLLTDALACCWAWICPAKPILANKCVNSTPLTYHYTIRDLCLLLTCTSKVREGVGRGYSATMMSGIVAHAD